VSFGNPESWSCRHAAGRKSKTASSESRQNRLVFAGSAYR
jgi:hypothetical protein